MRYEILPARVRGSGLAFGASLRIETPGQPASDHEIQQLFEDCASNLERREESGATGICEIKILLRSTEGLAPPNSRFLEVMCAFLSEHPFDGVTRLLPTWDRRLVVRIASAQVSPPSDGDETIFAEATNRICGAYWQNDGLRSEMFKVMDVPFVLSQDVINRIVVDTKEDELWVTPPGYQATLIARDALADPSDVLQVSHVGVALTAVGTAFMDSVVDRALNVFPGISDRPHLGPPRFVVASDRAASVVARLLPEYQRGPNPLRSIDLVMGTRHNLAMLGVDAPRLDGMSMIKAFASRGICRRLRWSTPTTATFSKNPPCCALGRSLTAQNL